MPVFLFDPKDADPRRTVFVDGTAAGFRSLSHWPGHATPPALAHDTSTGIALRWAALPVAEREALLGPFESLANNHYDTDGVLSAWVVLHPERALTHADLLLRAAAAGDFCVWQGQDALAIDLTVEAIASHPDSPLVRALPADVDDATRHARAYAWFFDALPELLGDPLRHRALFVERMDALVADVARVDALLSAGPSEALSVERLPEHDLTVVRTDAPITMLGLHRAAGDLWRVLHCRSAADGWRHRFVYRDASWFDLVSVHPLPRAPLEPVVAALQHLEDAAHRGGSHPPVDTVPSAAARSSEDAAGASFPPGTRWWSTSIAGPVPELGYGPPERRPHGFFADPELHLDPSSALAPDVVRDTLVALLGSARD